VPTVWNTDGTCASGCPPTTFASAPEVSEVGNWHHNADRCSYDFFHAILGKCYLSLAEDGQSQCYGSPEGTPVQTCTWNGWNTTGACWVSSYFVVEGTSGNPDRLYFTWGNYYAHLNLPSF
jgi:hypothetical protein